MNFSKTASYSLSVLSYMAKHEDINMSAAYLHEKLILPYPYLRHVLKNLSRSGFIHSIRGRNGGYTFSKKKEDIFLADIIEATDGLDSLNKCILGFTDCPFNNECIMHTLWETTRTNILKVMKETSLAHLVKNNDISSL
jgi:Rrf2 family transcriptional regulator, iron-sulfur cluster assembly transcription factor